MAPLSTNLLGGSAAFQSSDLAPLTGSEGMGSAGMMPLSTELNLLGGSAELPALSSNFPDGSTAGIGGSAETIGEGIAGSLTNGSAETVVGSVAECGICEAVSGSITGTSGSLTGESGSTGGSSDVLLGSLSQLTAVNGSVTALTGSLENGSMMGTLSTNLGSEMGAETSLEALASLGGTGAGSLMPVIALTASAGAAALAAGVANGTIMLPPLPFLPAMTPMPAMAQQNLPDNGRG